MPKTDSTREKIMAAAWEVFVEKGYDGARMQQIADRAGANKAMIYYYFSSKDALFEAIIKENFKNLFKIFTNVIMLKDIDLETMISQVVHEHLNFLLYHPEMARLFLREIHSDNPIIRKVMNELHKNVETLDLKIAVRKLEKAMNDGKMRSVDPVQTIWNLIGLDLFYFVAKPLLNILWQDFIKDDEAMLQEREKSIVDLLLYGLLPR